MKKFLLHRKAGQRVRFEYIKHRGIKTQQTPGTFEVFDKFFEEQKFDRVVELGTYNGGLTLYLASKLGDRLHSFDIKNFLTKDISNELKLYGVNMYFQNIFKHNDVQRLLTTDSRVLVLCDNGYKAEEVKIFSPYLKNDDVIMAHDYFYDEDEFYNNTQWKACEIIEKHFIYDYFNLYQPYSDMFKKVFWACKIIRR